MKILIVGGGAAGLMAAATAARRGNDVTILERNPRMARKVMITGKGRCNVTNACSAEEVIAHIPQNGRFLYSALNAFAPEDMMKLVESCGVPLKVERGNRVFPVSDKAVDVVDALVGYARKSGAKFIQARVTDLIIEDDVCTGVKLEDGRSLEAYAVVVCTGGKSYPITGSSGDGYALAKQAGHVVTPPRPSLIPLETVEYDCTQMQGLSLRNCGLEVIDQKTGKCIYKDFGEMLFTHFGVSGPMILSASAHMREMTSGRYKLLVDLKPALDEQQLDARLVRELTEQKNVDFHNAVETLLPKKMIPVAVRRSGIPPQTKCNSVTKEQRHHFVELLKAFPITIDGFRPIEEAIITSGGVSVKEINSKTMESKLVSGLFFAGEVLDVDAYTGGFNLQIAFSTGVAAGNGV